MRIVNSSLATLSSLSKAGFRAGSSASTPSPPSSTPSSRSTSAVRPAASSTSLRGNAAHGANKDKAEQTAKEAGRALQELRKLARESAPLGGKRVEVEKAAGSLVASLVEMELYRLALIELSAMRSAILSWYSASTPPAPPTSSSLLAHVPSFALPLPPSSYFAPPTLSEALSSSAPLRPTAVELVPLVIALQQYLVGCLFRAPELSSSEEGQRRRAEALEEILRLDGRGDGGGPLDWRALLDREGAWDGVEQSAKEALLKRTDAMMTSMFGTVTKGCTGTDGIVAPEILLTLRTHALLYYSTTSALAPSSDKLPAFHDQLRKILLLYGRSAEAAPYSYSPMKVCSAVKDAFETVVGRLEGKGVRCEGARWGEVCDVVLHIAKRADDLALIERVSSLLGSPSPSPSSSSSPPVDPCSQLAQLCAKTIEALSVFDIWLKSHQSPDKAGGVADQLRRVLGWLPVLTQLRCLPSSEVPTEAKSRLDKTLDALRHVLARHLRSGGVDGPPKRPDQLLTPPGSSKPVEPDPSKREIGDLVRECLDKLAGHVEHVALEGQGGEAEEKERERLDNLRASAVDTLVLLAYDRLVVEDRTTYTPCFTLLSRALPLVRRRATLALSLHYSIRTLASTLYNIGGTLFNVQKPEAAVRFVQRACELGSEALARAREEEGEGEGEDGLMEQMGRLKLDHEGKEDEKRRKDKEERKEAVRDLERLMARRWELLAIAQHAIGEKKAAYDAYVSAVRAQPNSILDSLSRDASTTPLSKLVDMHASLYKLIQRLTRIATFDLLLPPSHISLSYSLSPPSAPTPAPSPAVQGILLELQLAAIDLTSEKLESQRAASAVLDALEGVYRAQEFPMRRARVLVRRMQQQCVGGEVARDLKAAATAAEIDALCSQEDLGQDAALGSFSSQYLALSHLHLAFHAHYAQLPSSTESASTEARQALSILRRTLEGALPPSPSAPAPQARTVAFQPSPTRQTTAAPPAAAAARRRTTRAAATPAAKGRAALKTPQTTRTIAGGAGRRGMPAVAEQVTPPSKSAVELKEPVRTPPRAEGSAAGLLLDDPERCYVLLETMAHLLGALGHSVLRISYLKFLRRLSSKLSEGSHAAFVTSSAHLAHEYLRLGKTVRAGLVFAQADQRLQGAAKAGSTVPPAVEVTHWLYYAEYLALLANHDRSAQAYETAMTLAEGLGQDDASTSTTARIIERTLLLQRTATAASVCSVMLQRKGDLARSLAPATQAMRVYQRALNNISRLTPSSKPSPDSNPSDTFTAPPNDHVTPLNDLVPASRKRNGFGSGGPQAAVSWQLAEQLASSILRVASLHLTRGTPKSAEFYALQAREFAQELGSARLVARATALRAEVRLHAGKLEEAAEDLAVVEGIVGTHSCPEAVEAQRLRADLHLRNSLRREAYQLYLEAQTSLESFVRSAAEVETTQTPIKRSSSAKHLSPVQHRSATKAVSPLAALSPSPSGGRAGLPSDWILPAAHAYLLRMQVALLRLQNKAQESQALLKRLSKLSMLEEDRADELKLLASIQLQDMLARCSSDPVLGMLPDSVLSMPAMGSSASAVVKIGTPRTGPTLLDSLKKIEVLLARAIAFSASRAQPEKLRELSLLSATMHTLHASVGKPSKRAAASVAHVLDLGVAVTLRREMLDAIDHKLTDSARHDDLSWPSVDPPSLNDDDDSNRQLLQTMRDRYRLETPEPILTDASMSSLLPPSWSTISLHLSSERDCLVLVRHRRDAEPIVFKLPLDRLARREGEEEEEAFTYDVAAGELKEIIELSNAGTQNAKHVDGKEARAAWWQERKQLDRRLQELLQTVEGAWLGAFKSVFYDARGHAPDAFGTFKARVEHILKRSIVRAAQDKKSTRFKLDDAVVECLAALPASSREEDLEDLFYFMMESFQFSGVPLACDETDVDQVVVDLREALEELHGTKSAPKGTVDPDEHTFLILDKTLQAFPWESLPCLRGRSFSRLPSLSFLRDRLDLAASRSTSEDRPFEIVVNPKSAAFVLNPGGDLRSTQNTFEPWLEQQTREVNWSGIVGRAPGEDEVKAALATKELFLYFGHGGAEQYVRSQTIRQLPRCAVTMLWGCSSGLLKDQGDFDPVGTPYHYMVAGSPALVANLWDVTDKDIDKFAQSVFDKTGLASFPTSTSSGPASLTSAVATSREVCNLRYLNGAAPVVYGVPVRFASPLC